VLHTNTSCDKCHTGATAGTSGGPGHFDGNIDVAGAFGTYPTNITKHAANSTPGTCSNVTCHNGPTSNPFTANPIVWGASVDCAGCHGYPPASTDHATVNPATVGVCNSCHSNSLNTTTINTPTASAFTDVQQHMDGVLQGGKCDSCHGYPPVQSLAGLGTNANYSSAKLQNYSGGGGVHSVAGHLPKTLKASQGFAFAAPSASENGCVTCHPNDKHNQGGSTFLTANVQVVVDPQFKFDKNRPIVYNAKQSGTGKTSGTCANVACHFQKSPLWSSQTYTQGH
jgi:predicted CxxxxCH...CXXCH cytochrome family protein